MQNYANLYAINKRLYKGIYNLQEHLQKTFTKMKCNVKLLTSLGNLTTKK